MLVEVGRGNARCNFGWLERFSSIESLFIERFSSSSASVSTIDSFDNKLEMRKLFRVSDSIKYQIHFYEPIGLLLLFLPVMVSSSEIWLLLLFVGWLLPLIIRSAILMAMSFLSLSVSSSSFLSLYRRRDIFSLFIRVLLLSLLAYSDRLVFEHCFLSLSLVPIRTDCVFSGTPSNRQSVRNYTWW